MWSSFMEAWAPTTDENHEIFVGGNPPDTNESTEEQAKN